jgi:glycosyltransferase involved in cell wall biosynthesis
LGLLDAFARSTQLRALGYELVLAGASGWKSRTIMEAVERTPGVRYVGYIDRQDKAALYALADLFVYPSLYEGFGFPVLESMVAGTPVVTSNRSSLGEVAGDAAYYVDPMNTDDIARAMERLLGNTELRNMCIERGLTRVKKFHWRTAAEQFLSILSE